MSCIKNCRTNNVQFVFVAGAAVFQVTSFADESDFISYEDDQVTMNTKRDTEGNAYTAGNDFVVRPFTLKVNCSDEAKKLDIAWKLSPLSLCGDAQLMTNCCTDQAFKSIKLVGVKAPSVGNEIGIYEFKFEGVAI